LGNTITQAELRRLTNQPKHNAFGTATLEQYRAHLKGQPIEAQPKARKKKPQPNVATEHEEQVTLLGLLTYKFPRVREMIYAVPNGGHRHWSVASKLKAEGADAGVADLALPMARCGYHALYIEMKRRPPGRSEISAEQKAWRLKLLAEGNAYFFGYGADEALEGISLYMSGDGQAFDAWVIAQCKRLGFDFFSEG